MDMSEPATKQDLVESMDVLRGEMNAMECRLLGTIATQGTELRGEIAAQGTELRGEMNAMENRLRNDIVGEIRSAVAVISEDFRKQVSAFDDKYCHLPGEVAELRGRFDEHAADAKIHRRPATVAPKRSRSH